MHVNSLSFVLSMVALACWPGLAHSQSANPPELDPQAHQRVEQREFGKTAEGATVTLYTLRNSKGMVASIMTSGATITRVLAPDRHGALTNVVLGADSFDAYKRGFNAPGAIMGRVANRISGAQFTLDGVEYKLAANNGRHHIHGGRKGFGAVNWDAKVVSGAAGAAAVEFSYRAKDGEEGYPGNLLTKVTYTLTDDNELRLDYEATTDKATPVNLTTHAYFNLAGAGDCLNHDLWIDSDRVVVADAELIPTGEIAPVKGTPLDFTTTTRIGARFNQLKSKINGYDNGYVLVNDGKTPKLAARLSEPASGRVMDVKTTQPGIQIYTGNHLNHGGVALETQHHPDSVHRPEFPTTILRPGETFKSTTIFAFSAK